MIVIVRKLLSYHYLVCSELIPDSFFEENKPTDKAPEFKTHTNMPLSFCETRWYSAWTVMERFYSIRKSLHLASIDINKGNKFSFSDTDGNQLLNLLHFLKPLVDGIKYCENNSHSQIDLLPLVESIQNYYRKSLNNDV